jgi:glycerophosphoryl diester phosphodiesterase
VTRPSVIAHRGSSAAHADNGWPAFQAAVGEGADAIECDVQRTRDDILVIRHDLALGERPVAELSAAELEAIAPGIVLLGDLLSWAQRVQIDLLVEVKEPDATAAVAATVTASGWCHRTVIGSFHGPALAAAKAGAEARHREGDNVALAFLPAEALLFDKGSGRRLDVRVAA